MTVETIQSGPYIGTGAVSNYDYDFQVQSKDDLEVAVTDTLDVTVILTVDVDYTVNDIGDDDGTITLTSPLTLDYSMLITAAYDYTQEVDVTDQGAFRPTLIERMVDKVTFLVSQLKLNTNDNTADIAINTADIAINADDIVTNTADIVTNTADIVNNTADIAINTADIAINTDDITAVTITADSALSIAANNASDITTNTGDIAINTDDITAVTITADSALSIATNNASDITNYNTIVHTWTAEQTFDELVTMDQGLLLNDDIFTNPNLFVGTTAYFKKGFDISWDEAPFAGDKSTLTADASGDLTWDGIVINLIDKPNNWSGSNNFQLTITLPDMVMNSASVEVDDDLQSIGKTLKINGEKALTENTLSNGNNIIDTDRSTTPLGIGAILDAQLPLRFNAFSGSADEILAPGVILDEDSAIFYFPTLLSSTASTIAGSGTFKVVKMDDNSVLASGLNISDLNSNISSSTSPRLTKVEISGMALPGDTGALELICEVSASITIT